jgi:flavin reductase (DIM6/NTAB) family NADH-FMN oxidoreductase RutF
LVPFEVGTIVGMSLPTPSHFTPVALDKAYRLINHGPTVLVSSAHAGDSNVMAAAWACALDFSPPKVTVVIDKATRTRTLVEQSGAFALCVPSAGLAALTLGVGTDSALSAPDKLARHGVKHFTVPGHALPLVEGCVAWLVCRLLPEPHNQRAHDLFIGEVVGAWADERVFRAGRWHFDGAPDHLRTLHYVAGGQFYVTGASLQVGGGG